VNKKTSSFPIFGWLNRWERLETNEQTHSRMAETYAIHVFAYVGQPNQKNIENDITFGINED